MTTITFRASTVEDFEFFFELHKATLGPYVDQVWGWDHDVQRAYLGRSIDFAATQVIVVDGADAGRLDLAERDGDVYVGLLEVAPVFQRRGIGTRVLREVLDEAFAVGRGVCLNVLKVNTDARRLYRRLGFAVVAETEIRWRMRADLPVHESNAATEDLVYSQSDPEVRLRAATRNDLGFLVEMARHASVIEDRPLPDPADDEVVEMLPAPGTMTIIAEDRHGSPLGAAWTYYSSPPLRTGADGAPLPELCLAVAPPQRGGGIGGMLLEALIAELAPRFDSMCANVHVRNPARRLYERKGFRDDGIGLGPLGIALIKDLRR
ncbi:GNAT family N-acetyltransferase [Mycolicibacterium neoaurum]|uniref:GNAT family N-acetyltransferase n=1 Tax=Mycolicibacterium neoaurum TaxID=1795 RepID=UPI001BCFBA59|nr:GNAT family N-acetyltransferase [Mycolicibacterium neoaurum]QVI28506.1 GNAT family N-acetyltransferase [Mycolicibacterium neoaurum]